MATIARVGRSVPPLPDQDNNNPLPDLFTDLIAYVIFFNASCEQKPPALIELRDKIVSLLNTQEERAKSIGVTQENFHEARFAVLSWVDEMILNSNWTHRTQWQHLMLAYNGTLNAGEEFFRHLELLPSQANNVREIYYLCISLGFEGRYAFGEERHALKDIKQRLYKQLCANTGDIRQKYARLFPEAYQKPSITPEAAPKSNTIWYIVAVTVPFILFVIFWFLLWQKSNELIASLDKPVISVPERDWAPSLVEELRKKGLRAVDEPDSVRITLESLLFAAGSAQLNSQADSKINDIVTTVKRYAPEKVIVIEGHASFEKQGDEERNQKLSLDRAGTVANAFIQLGFRRDQLSAEGKGSKEPVASNQDESGRIKNRRVEIIIKK